MRQGFVYVLTNPAMPGMVKIGKTGRTARLRCEELYQTGVPYPFEVVGEVTTPDCDDLERRVHIALQDYRVSEAREFFHVDVDRAVSEVECERHQQICDIVERYTPGLALVDAQYIVDEAAVARLARDTGIKPSDISIVLEHMGASDLWPGIVRAAAKSRYFAQRNEAAIDAQFADMERRGAVPIARGKQHG